MNRTSAYLQRRLFLRALRASLQGLLLGALCAGLLFSLWFGLRGSSGPLTLQDQLWLMGLSLPILAPMLIPLSALVGTLSVLEDLSMPPHAHLLQALGASPWTWCTPLLLNAGLLGGLGLGSSIGLEHAAWREARLTLLNAERHGLEASAEAPRIFRPGPGWALLKLPGSSLALVAEPHPQQELWMVSAQAHVQVEARARTLHTRLGPGELLHLEPSGPTQAGHFDLLELTLPLETSLGKRPLVELTGEALLERLDSAERKGRGGQAEALALHRRVAQPLCALSFCLLVCGLRARLRVSSTGPWAGSALILIGWYAVQRASDTVGTTLSDTLGTHGAPDALSFWILTLLAWSPVVVPSLLGWTLLNRAEHSL